MKGETMNSPESGNVRLHELLTYAREGRFMDAMLEFYAENVTMEEPMSGPTHGLEENIKREQRFLDAVKEVKTFQVTHSATGPNTAMYENVMDWVGTDDKNYHMEQVSVQTWKNGKIIYERFYYS